MILGCKDIGVRKLKIVTKTQSFFFNTYRILEAELQLVVYSEFLPVGKQYHI